MQRNLEKWQEQFENIIELYKGRVFNMLYKILPDKSIIEDVAQEVFIRIYKGLPYFREKSKFTTWLYRIVHNVAISELRKKRPQHSDDIEIDKLVSFSNETDQVKLLTEKQIKEKIDSALNLLPENFRTVLILYYMEELSYNDIAETLDLPIGTVKTYLFRGKKMLRHILKNLNNI